MPLPWNPRIYLSPQFFSKLALTVLAQDLGIDRTAAAVLVVRFWWYAHPRGGVILHTGAGFIDGAFATPGFEAAMMKAGWLVADGLHMHRLPEFDKYLSKAATRRIERRIRTGKAVGFRRIDSEADIEPAVRDLCAGAHIAHTSGTEQPHPKKKSKGRKLPPNPTLFERFYHAYPKKKARGDAAKAFKAANVDEDLLAVMLEAITRQKESRQWRTNDGQYIPYPATWIRAQRWLDEGDERLRSGGRVGAEAGKYDVGTEVIGGGEAHPAPVPRRAEPSLFDESPPPDDGDRTIPY
jgi:hypothetical protein